MGHQIECCGGEGVGGSKLFDKRTGAGGWGGGEVDSGTASGGEGGGRGARERGLALKLSMAGGQEGDLEMGAGVGGDGPLSVLESCW